MNNRLYGNLIFELSKPGRRGYSLSKNEFGHHEVPAEMRRCEDAKLPECDELTWYATTQILAQTTSALTTASTLSVAVL